MARQDRTARIVLATIDPHDKRTHDQQLGIASPPFSSGKWTLGFHPVFVSSHAPWGIALRWTECIAPVPCRTVKLAAKESTSGRTFFGDFPFSSKARFPIEEDGGITLKVGRLSEPVEVYLEVQLADEPIHPDRCLALIDRRETLDVCLAFPPGTKTLWASSAALSQVSPWWRTLLATSGFSEDTSRVQPVLTEHDDSDAEDDESSSMPISRRTLTPPPSPPLSPDFGFDKLSLNPTHRTVPVTGTSYATYRAFLFYLYTGHLSFAPLTSSFLSPSTSLDAAKTQRRAALATHTQLYPSQPTPISPKSLFALAHFLEIRSLAERALDGLRDALTPSNVAFELFGVPALLASGDPDGGGDGEPDAVQPTFGEVYDAVWDVEVSWARLHWGTVGPSKGMQEHRERMERDGATPHEARTLWRLLSGKEGE
ncbi:hypothetical protein JCM10207_004925 [Rhodosporidiobolus poonsookiae]